jgi:TetR/AcrR family transcriptional regulator, transcriptional repressor for nem operon
VETLHRKGFNATSVQDITDAAKVPKGSFYNHFESKGEIAVAAPDRYWQWVQASLAILSDATTPPVDRLKQYFQGLCERGRRHAYRPGCMIGNMSTERRTRAAGCPTGSAAYSPRGVAQLTPGVREAQAAGVKRHDLDAAVVAAFLLNSFEGAVMRSKGPRRSCIRGLPTRRVYRAGTIERGNTGQCRPDPRERAGDDRSP